MESTPTSPTDYQSRAEDAATRGAVRGRRFPSINRGYDGVFRSGEMSVGLVVPIESYSRGPVPTMAQHLRRVVMAESLGFAAVWLRDVPFNVPAFGDAGQPFDPFVYLGYLAASTERIALGVASIVLPLRHPAHVAKAAASVDVLSSGRLILGVASGDRPEEYPALAVPFDDRGARFRNSFDYIRRMSTDVPAFDGPLGRVGGGMDMLPKPSADRLPLLITGSSQQAPEWIAQNGDGWMIYPRHPSVQERIIERWREQVAVAGVHDKPILQPLYVDLVDDEGPPQPIHLGFRIGPRSLVQYLRTLQKIGVDHVALNLRYNQANVDETLERLAADVLPSLRS